MLNIQSCCPKDENRLKAEAIKDAKRLTPDFSNALHHRIMRAVLAVDLKSIPVRPHGLPKRIFPLGIAAAIALAFVPTAMRLLSSGTPPAMKVAHVSGGLEILPVTSQSPIVAGIRHSANPIAVQTEILTAKAGRTWASFDRTIPQPTRYLVGRVPLRSDEGVIFLMLAPVFGPNKAMLLAVSS